MESMKHKMEVLLLIICLLAAAALVWYVLAGLPGGETMEGTLVEAVRRAGIVSLSNMNRAGMGI